MILLLIFNAKDSKSLYQKLLYLLMIEIFFFFKFYVFMQFKTMKHDAIYLNSSTEALFICQITCNLVKVDAVYLLIKQSDC